MPFTFRSKTPLVPKETHPQLKKKLLPQSPQRQMIGSPAARMYSAPLPGWTSRLLTSVPTGRAPSGYASPSLADTAEVTGFYASPSAVSRENLGGGLPTCHPPDDPRSFNDVSRLHGFRGDDPALPVASCHQGDVSRPFVTQRNRA